jgi:hypothetical protein
LPADDRWSLAQYVLSLGPATEADTVADLKKVGIDPNDPNAGSSGPKTIPIEFAIDRIAE